MTIRIPSTGVNWTAWFAAEEARIRAEERENSKEWMLSATDKICELEGVLAEWAEKDGNSPGYNLEKAKTYGRLAAEWKSRALTEEARIQNELLDKIVEWAAEDDSTLCEIHDLLEFVHTLRTKKP